MDISLLYNTAIALVLEYGPKLIGAVFVLVIGLWVIKLITRGIRKIFSGRNIDPSLTPFLLSIINITLKILLVVSVMGMMGVEMTSFIAILGAAGLAVGMALSGTLQNFAGGVIILIFKPFKVGDYIEAQGYGGSVSSIQIFNTYLKTPDNKLIVIPNGGLSTGSLTNYSAEETRRVDWTFGIGYDDDYDKAKALLVEMISADKRIMTDPEPFFALAELADSSVNIAVRAWVKAPDYWGVFFSINENVFKSFKKEQISIPYPQMDVHVSNQ